MSHPPLVQIHSPQKLGEDERGKTFEFCLSRQQDGFVLVNRKAGSVSGNTYHEGKSLATSPKIFILISGKIRISYRQIDTTEQHSEEVDAPAIIEIKPLVTHKVEALTDFILLEANAIKDIQHDRIREEV